MFELERTFLAKYLPRGYEKSPHREIVDLYIPKSREHPVIRLRKKGDKYELTKKEPVSGTDSSHQLEQTINLTKEEFLEFAKLESKKVRKIRYEFSFEGRTAEIDVFQDELKGLVVFDFEFEKEQEKDNFQIPDFCLADITQELFTAGGMLCGKSYADIENELSRYNYKKIIS